MDRRTTGDYVLDPQQYDGKEFGECRLLIFSELARISRNQHDTREGLQADLSKLEMSLLEVRKDVEARIGAMSAAIGSKLEQITVSLAVQQETAKLLTAVQKEKESTKGLLGNALATALATLCGLILVGLGWTMDRLLKR